MLYLLIYVFFLSRCITLFTHIVTHKANAYIYLYVLTYRYTVKPKQRPIKAYFASIFSTEFFHFSLGISSCILFRSYVRSFVRCMSDFLCETYFGCFMYIYRKRVIKSNSIYMAFRLCAHQKLTIHRKIYTKQ